MPHVLDLFIDTEKLKENPTTYPEVFRVLEIIRPNWQKENIRVKVRIIILIVYDAGTFLNIKLYDGQYRCRGTGSQISM